MQNGHMKCFKETKILTKKGLSKIQMLYFMINSTINKLSSFIKTLRIKMFNLPHQEK